MLGVPLLVDELERRGEDPLGKPLSRRQRKLKEDFVQKRGFWTPLWDTILALDPDLLDAYTELSAAAQAEPGLDSILRELILVALDASTAHLHEDGARVHIRNALDAGATPDQVLAVFEITTAHALETWRENSTALRAITGSGD